ncbi:MAG: glycosyltransferase family 2 protein [Alphaproteobacteria bacterium]|nr:glycosyltransferase family 2 protein [Alphaproteobacteria bacterium]OJV13868.1 MAG: hypothetical protein BGO27_08230 [Alphaproteobacteria bacterium 33-17]
MNKKFKTIFISLAAIALVMVLNYKKYSIKNAAAQNAEVNISEKMVPVFNEKGIDNIAYIGMVKDEDDIIFENLVWHYSIGFRKFIILNNNSSDQTLDLISKFKEKVKDTATVIIINDPIFEYIQSRKMTGTYKFASSIWSEVEWIFPIDADEFIVPTKDLREALNKVAANIDAIQILCARHHVVKGSKIDSTPFYDNIKFRENAFKVRLGKVAVRAHKDIVIEQGNHFATKNWSNVLGKKTKIFKSLSYTAGNTLGIHMTEYPIRSLSQVHKKFLNGAKANIAVQKQGKIALAHGSQWSSYEKEMEEKGLKAAEDRFEKSFIDKDNAVYDPLPIADVLSKFGQ